MVRRANFFTLGLVALTLITGPAVAQDSAPKPVDMQNAETIIGFIADTDKALALDWESSKSLWQALNSNRKSYFDNRDCPAGYGFSLDQPMAGIDKANFSTWYGKECSYSQPNMALSLVFGNADDTRAFRTLLEKRFGAPDASCSNEDIAYWHVKPNVSLRWMSRYERADTFLIASEPLDPACAVNAAKDKIIISQAFIDAMAQYLRSAPIPWENPDKIGQWLSVFGKTRRLNNSNQSNWAVRSDMAMAFTTLADKSGKPALESTITIILSGGNIMAEPKLRRALTQVFGPPDPACLKVENAAVWQSAQSTVLRLAPLDNNILLQIINQPLKDYKTICEYD